MASDTSTRFKTARRLIQHKLTENYLSEKGPLDSLFSYAADIKATAASRAAGLGRRRCSRRGPRADSIPSTQQDMSNITETVTDRDDRGPSSPSKKETFLISFLDSRKLSRIYKGRTRSLSFGEGVVGWSL